MFSIAAASVYNSVSAQSSLFSTSTLAFVISSLFDDSLSNKYEVIFHCGFNVHFLND